MPKITIKKKKRKLKLILLNKPEIAIRYKVHNINRKKVVSVAAYRRNLNILKENKKLKKINNIMSFCNEMSLKMRNIKEFNQYLTRNEKREKNPIKSKKCLLYLNSAEQIALISTIFIKVE